MNSEKTLSTTISMVKEIFFSDGPRKLKKQILSKYYMSIRNIAFVLILSVFSCKPFFSEELENPNVLDQESAILRSEQVENVRYKIELDITGDNSFKGKTDIFFDLVKLDSPLRFDLSEGFIHSIRINNEITESIQYEKGFFVISPNLLLPGKNQVTIEYTHPFSRTGNGLHKFTDPQDNETYLYSQFETNHAKSMFPCFDQPDIKAKYSLTVTHPKNWNVVSSTKIKKVKEVNGKVNTSEFYETELFSTYVFSLHAGPYKIWNDSYKTIPLRLMARKSMSEYINHKMWFKITKQGFFYFENYFGIPYPFDKYDQLIVPEFNFGAMENVSAVTYSERYLSRGKMSRSMEEKLASVILHEMAHMWFGNLVTMKWWDGLWLNESFATYLAAKAQYNSTQYKEAWETFFTGMKSWAYRSDQSVTTHPIQGKIENTEEAFVNFDGITYGKGASVLRQLEFFIGEDEFQKGVSNYLKKYSYKNAKLEDFLNSLSETSGKDLKKWSNNWLESTGFNRILATHNCNKNTGKMESLTITQDHQTNTKIARDHKTRVAIFKIQGNKSILIDEKTVEYGEGETTIQWEKEIDCPDFVYPNYMGYDYVRVEYPREILEEKDLMTLRNILIHSDTLTSLMLWRDLYEEVREGHISINRYAGLAMEILPSDKRDIVLESNIGHITSGSFSSYHSFQYLLKQSDRQKILNELEEFTWENMQESDSFSDRKKLWLRNYIKVGQSQSFYERSIAILENKKTIPGINIDQDLRWSFLKKICSLTPESESIHNLLEKEKQRDKSRIGMNSAMACEASFPDPVTKGKWMIQLTNPSEEITASTLRYVMHYIFPLHQLNLQIPFVEYYYQNIRDGKISGDENYQEYYSGILAPQFCTEENRHIMKKFLNNNRRRLPVNIKKNLEIALEQEDECIRIRKAGGY